MLVPVGNPGDTTAVPAAVLRMARTPQAATHLPRNLQLLDALAASDQLPYQVPVGLSEIVPGANGAGNLGETGKSTAAVLQQYIPGQAHPPHTGDLQDLRSICEHLAAVDTKPLQPYLAEPFTFRGRWTAAKTEVVQQLPTRLPEQVRNLPWPDFFVHSSPERFPSAVSLITETVTAWTAQPPVTPSLVHGDLAGHNMHWLPVPGEQRWQLHGILDWDLACIWDPALNPAYLSLWHGEEKLPDITRDRDELQRARVWLGAMALESLYDTALRVEQVRPKRWLRLLSKTLPRIDRAMQVLH